MSTGKLPLNQIVGSFGLFYDWCCEQCHPDANGSLSSTHAADLLKTSGLPEKTLSEIWQCSDSSGKGFLTKYEFHVALKLVALAQNKIEPKMYNLSMNAPCPKLAVNMPSYINPNSGNSPSNIWSISLEEQNKYSNVFDGLDSNNGKLSGESVKPVFINSKLPVTTLGQIWTLSDIDKDGSLDREEFILAMYLIYKCLTGEEPPKTLNPNVIPPSKRRPPSVNSIQSSFKPNTSTGSLQSSFFTSSMRVPISEWVVGKLEKERFDNLFFAADKDKDGLLSGLEIKETFVQSGLPQNVLAKIWDLCDINKSGMLNSEQFALAMHLINDQISSAGTKMIPSTLTAEMIPPSLRVKIGDGSSAENLTLNSFGIKVESDEVYKEIEILKRERAQVEQICRQSEADYKSQLQEVQELQETLDRTAQTAQALSKQKEEAQHRLDELTEQKNRTQVILDETRNKCKDERDQLETLKRQIGNQSASIEEKRDDLKRLQGELNDLIREESSLRDQVQQHHSRLAAIEQETSSTEKHILAAENKNKELESLRTRLQEVLEQYESIITSPGQIDLTKVPDSAMVDNLLASNLVEQDKHQISTWPSDDPFMKDDPFSSIADPFGGGDPFSSSGDPFSSTQDPFSTPHDPFASANGWSSNITNDHNTAFSIGNIDDLFKNISTTETSNHNHFESSDDPFGFGDSPFDNVLEKTVPPPRPTKAPQANTITKSKTDVNSFQSSFSETDQLSWAKMESEREAREAEAVRKREQADFEMALKLSQAEYKTQERKKTPKNKK